MRSVAIVKVAPLVGAWIEIYMRSIRPATDWVAPLVGAWIEIVKTTAPFVFFMSLLSWERGLKLYMLRLNGLLIKSLLSWERGLKYLRRFDVVTCDSRSSRGSVD